MGLRSFLKFLKRSRGTHFHMIPAQLLLLSSVIVINALLSDIFPRVLSVQPYQLRWFKPQPLSILVGNT